MFSSRRKSRDPAASIQNGFGQPQNGVNSNALAAASAIGNALKTGTPIPRSNSLQRTSGIQRSSSLVGGRPVSRSGSLLGLQGPPTQFQQQQQQQQKPSRTQSLTSGSVYNQKLKQKRASKVTPQSGPKLVKKHIPGPYGLITIEVPAEEEIEPKPKSKRVQSLTRPSYSDGGSLRSFQSSNSQSTSSKMKRAIINEPLKEVDEEIGDDFEQTVPLHPTLSNDAYENSKFDSIPGQAVQQPQQNLTFIEEEEELKPENLVADDLSNLKLSKEEDESQIEKELESEQTAVQDLLTAKVDHPKTEETLSPAPSEIKDIRETIITTEPDLKQFEEAGDEQQHFISIPVDTPAENSDVENEVLDQYTDIDPPSTAKSNDTITPAQSSYTTAENSELESYSEKDPHQEPNVHSMAQQLRPTIPSLRVSGNEEFGINDATVGNGLSLSNSSETAASSLYSNEQSEYLPNNVPRSNSPGSSGNGLQVPARSSKRSENSTSPRKSALKSKSGSTINLNNNETSSPANAAYLSLTTAENTRLNALSSSNLPATNLSRTNSSRHSLRQEPAAVNGFKNTLRSQPSNPTHPPNQPRSNGQHHQQQHQQQQRQSVNHQHAPQQRASVPSRGQQFPNSAAISQQNASNKQKLVRPSGPGPVQRPPSQVIGSQRSFRQSQNAQQIQQTQGSSQQKSHSNAAALNAALKKNEPPKLPQLNRASSFEKERPQESNAAFKKRSLRDPSINQHVNVESQMGFYRQQAAQQQQHQQHTPNKNQSVHAQSPAKSNQSNGNGFGGFKSRFNDSDDSGDEGIPTPKNPKHGKSNRISHDFAPPPNNPTLRNTKSQFTLRSTSNSATQEKPSPAKSLPTKRNTRYFSEADKDDLFNEHVKKAEANLEKDKKKSKFGGKLKKLFGRS